MLRCFLRREDLVPLVAAAKGEQILFTLVAQWERHKLFTEWMRRLFLVVDNADAEAKRQYNTRGTFRSTTSAGLLLYRDHVFAEQSRRIQSEISKVADSHRSEEAVDLAPLKSVAELYLLMGLVGSERHRELKSMAAVVAIAVVSAAASLGTFCCPGADEVALATSWLAMCVGAGSCFAG
jgi:hypothetical protein